MIYINDFTGTTIVNTITELVVALQQRPAFNANHFIIALDENAQTQINAFVKNDECVVYYLCETGGSFVSIGDSDYSNEIETFYENSSGSDVVLARENIILFERFVLGAKEFITTKLQPMNINWIEL